MEAQRKDSALLIIGSLFFCALAQGFYRLNRPIWYGHGALIISLMLLLLFLRIRAPEPPGENDAATPACGRRASGACLFSFGCLLSLAAAGHLAWRWEDRLGLWAALFACGGTLAGLGADLFQGYGRSPKTWAAREILVFFLIVAVGAIFRLALLNYFPPPSGFSSLEEAQAGMIGYHILYRGDRPWIWVQSSYTTAAAFWLGGVSIVSMRYACAVMGALTLIPFYLLARRLCGVSSAAFAAFLFAVCTWHSVVSRYQHNVYPGIFFLTITLCLIGYAYRSRRLSVWLWMGVFGGLALYDYDAFKSQTLFVIVFAGAAALYRSFRRDRSPLGPLLAIAFMLVTALPVGAKMARVPSTFFNGVLRAFGPEDAIRSYNDTGDWGKLLRSRLEKVPGVAAIFVNSTEKAGYVRGVLPGDPVLDPASSGLFILGLASTCFSAANPINLFFLFVFAVISYGGAFLHQVFDMQRITSIIPAVFFFIALFTSETLKRVAQTGADRANRGAKAVMLVLAAAALIWNGHYFFGRLMNDKSFRAIFHNSYTVLARFVMQYPADRAWFYVVSHAENFFQPNDYAWVYDYGTNGTVRRDVLSLLKEMTDFPKGKKVILAIQRPFEFEATEAWLHDLRPRLECRPFGAEEERRASFGYCELSAEDAGALLRAAEAAGIRASYRGLGGSAPAALERREPFLGQATFPEVFRAPEFRQSGAAGVEAHWKGELLAESDGEYAFRLYGPAASSSMSVDGAPIRNEISIRLSRGRHTAEISAVFRNEDDVWLRAEWKPEGVKGYHIVPFWRMNGGRR